MLLALLTLNCGRIYRNEEMWSAAADGDISTMRRMMAWGASPDTIFESGMTALHIAIFNDQLETAQFLLDHGADIERKTPRGESSMDFVHSDEMRNLLQYYRNRHPNSKK